MKEIKFLDIDVTGSEDELLQIELLMVLFGYSSDERWNQHRFNDDVPYHKRCRLSFYAEKFYCYFDYENSNGNAADFKATDIAGILKYIESYQSNYEN